MRNFLLGLLVLLPTLLSAQVSLNWRSDDLFVDGFRIEKSTDGKIFQRLGEVDGSVRRFVDNSFSGGRAWYRVLAYNSIGFSEGKVTAAITTTKEPEFINISTRSYVGKTDDVQIAGFTINEKTLEVLIRAVGPGLAKHGVPNTLEDPFIELFRQTPNGGELVLTNDNWGNAENKTELIAASRKVFAFALDEGSKDAAVLARLTSGSYTVIVRGNNNSVGVNLVEVYKIQ